MENTEPQMAFAAKEEILRNILKTHAVILIEGWDGTGKTVTTFKAVNGMGKVYYYSEPAEDVQTCLSKYNDNLTIVKNTRELRSLQPGKQCVIFDNVDRLGSEARGILETMVRERATDRKLIVITQVVLDSQYILENMDVVVRFKKNTAEMLHSKLCDLNS